jgi:hypothetical protein
MARRSLLTGALSYLRTAHPHHAATPAFQSPWNSELPYSYTASRHALQFIRPAHAQAQAMAVDYPFVPPMPDTYAADASPGATSLADASKAAHAAPAQSAASFKKTFYKRLLPSPPATAFSSPEGVGFALPNVARQMLWPVTPLYACSVLQPVPLQCGITASSTAAACTRSMPLTSSCRAPAPHPLQPCL